MLQPAEIFLNRSGEEIRRRTFTLTDPSGPRICVCAPTSPFRSAAKRCRPIAPLPARLCLQWPGLPPSARRNPDRPTQFFQAGAELLGLEDRAAGESEILSLVIEALRACGLNDFSLRIGDLSLFGALVDALALPAQWRSRLKRHFWRAGYVESLLYWLGHGDGAPKLPGTRAETRRCWSARADAPPAGRTREEIIARAMDRAAEAAALRLDPGLADAIAKLLDISGPAEESLARIRALLKTGRHQLWSRNWRRRSNGWPTSKVGAGRAAGRMQVHRLFRPQHEILGRPGFRTVGALDVEGPGPGRGRRPLAIWP